MMKGCSFLALAVCASTLLAAEPLQVRLVSYSLPVLPAQIDFGTFEDTLSISSQGPGAEADHVLAFAPDDVPTSHWGTFIYEDGQLGEIIPMDFILNVPSNDGDGNGIPDVLEYHRPISATSNGQFQDPEGVTRNFTARWTRSANSVSGTVRITLGSLVFNHQYFVFEYSGPMTATAEGTSLKGTVALERMDVPGDTLNGEIELSTATPGKVSLVSTKLQGAGGEFIWNNPGELELDVNEYFRFLDVVDGNPGSDVAVNFNDWIFLVKDVNDADGDGTPDLTDNGTVTPPAEPRLEIIRNGNGVRLLIHGDVGRVYTLESSTALPIWGNPTAVTITVSPQAVDLAAPTVPTFWRAKFP